MTGFWLYLEVKIQYQKSIEEVFSLKFSVALRWSLERGSHDHRKYLT